MHAQQTSQQPLQQLAPWERSHLRVQAAAVREAESDLETARALVDALRDEVHMRLGMASFTEYVAASFGIGRHTANERIRVSQALGHLPQTEAAFESGDLKFSVVKEITRVATASTEAAWIEAAEGQSVREVEHMVSGRRIGDRPTDLRRPEDQVHKIRHDVHPETYSAWVEARAQLERNAGHKLSDDELVLEMARVVLGGPTEDGRASYQIAIDVCETCGRTEQLAGGTAIEVPPEIVEMATCDAQEIPKQSHVGQAKQDVAPATKRKVRRRQKNQCAVPGCTNHLFLDIHHIIARADGGSHDAENLVLLCGTHHRAYHRGYLLIDGPTWDELRFAHADGTTYGKTPRASASLSQKYQDVYDALVKLGYRQKEARNAVERTRSHLDANATWDDVIRTALQMLQGGMLEPTRGLEPRTC